MATTKGQLKYLWTAYYQDGSSLKQPEDDRSKAHDDSAEWNPSSFRDIDLDKVATFWISDGSNYYGVDLTTGEFLFQNYEEASGRWTQEDQNLELSEPRRLIYFREVRKNWIDGVEQEPYVNRYFIGWQAKDKTGRNHKYTIGVE